MDMYTVGCTIAWSCQDNPKYCVTKGSDRPNFNCVDGVIIFVAQTNAIINAKQCLLYCTVQ